jgi:hypothetical protein
MAVYGGPEVVTDGLVLCLDAGNARSFRGRAATNLVVSPKSVTTGYATTVPTRLNNQLVNFDRTYTAGMLVGTGGQWFAYTGASTTNGNRYTASWYMKAGSLTTVFLTWGGAHNGNQTNFTFNLVSGQITISTLASGETYGADNLGNGWWRVWYTSTLSSGNYYFPQINIGSGSVYIGGLQIETGSSPSSFVEGTRGTTVATGGGWADLSGRGNHAELINGVGESRGNGGSLLFDGTDDYLRPNVSHSYLQSSALEVFFNSSSHGSGYKTIVGYRHNGGYSYPTIGSIWLNGSVLQATVITSSEVYRSANAGSISTNTPYHIVLNKDTVTGKLELFKNGFSAGSQTFDPLTYGYWSGGYIGADILDIGKSTNTNSSQGWGSDYFQGSIYTIRLYSRILSPLEIQQNYAATRGRFGL